MYSNLDIAARPWRAVRGERTIVRMPAKPDKTEELLTEIRDLLKSQHDAQKQDRTVRMVLMVSKGVFYACAFAFAAYAASYYASTILKMTGQ
jgi:hypothetical protein